MKGDRGRAPVLGDGPGLQEGDVLVVDPDPQLDGDRDRAGGIDGGPDDAGEQGPVHGEGRPRPLPGHLAGRAAEVEVDVVDADLVHQPGHRRAHHPGVDTAQLHAADRLVGPEGGHAQGLGVALDQRPGRDHLAHVEAGAEGPAQPAEGRVGDPGHRGQHHRWVDGHRPQLERRKRQHRWAGGPGGASGSVVHVGTPAHRSVIGMSRRMSIERSRGRESPMTFPGSPSTPSTNGADRPSRVNAPATANASPVAR